MAILAVVIGAWQWSWPWALVAIPSVAFVAMIVIHDRTLRERDAARRAVAHYREGLERCAERWAGHGLQASDYVGAEHPFAADLDLFGTGSLFELLCRARTRAGEQRLAAWLTVHAERRVEVEAIRARQRSVQALTEALDLREDLAVLGVAARVEVRPEKLIDWGRAPGLFSPKQRRILAIAGVLTPLASVAAIVAWTLGLGPYALLVVLAGSGAVHKAFAETLARVAGPADRHAHELEVLAALFERIEAERFEDPTRAGDPADPGLVAVQRAFTGAGAEGQSSARASVAIHRLRTLVGWYEAQRNALFVPIALALAWGPSFARAIEGWRTTHGPQIAGWLDALAELEALASLAGHAFENPDDVFPELVPDADNQTGPVLDGEALGHPLLPRRSCVRNDLHLVAPIRAHVISGSNMSGKSTFLRTVGSNVVLALAGAPVRAARLRVTPVRIGATLRVQDSLREGASRFWAELTRLRTVSELADAAPTLFLLDEIFHGTNSHDRRIGAEALLRSLLERGAIGLLTTHDLALAKAAEALAPAATNVHFEDELRDGELVFDYRMRPGVVQKSNALALMRSVGLDV